MKKGSFIYQYLFNPRTVGAVRPSSGFLSNKMVEGIKYKDTKYIVEYGPGTGVFTEKILERRNKETLVVVIESNQAFYQVLKKKFNNVRNLIIIFGSAEHIEQYLKEYNIPYVDYIISGLPFASLPQNVSKEILSNTLKVLKTGGEFVTFQYTKVKIPFLRNYFPNITVNREFRNIPPAYILHCKL
ncbi:class I SAM-dependent methyltransferase [Ornithinibacillus bavariensis]|uniref:SAM-dependent methyltransferase n=1 Tax=Ornithinibacillus bavariensis TaxID=545502 RepID=A0A919XB41_9BACI|nr:rRNA adenine N-6-methyltransferase family protein [Ornithinibacillus bavariensis]GIO27425.1 SAM-dependent methyltransferase [Ornithinibacillus bavariensis]HAM82022.1 SAM-dependent methyltransferase [Ornithinibacillus sp.]